MVRRFLSDVDPNVARSAAAKIYTLCFPVFLTDAVRRAHPLASSQFHLLTENGLALAPGLQEDDPRVVVASAWIDLSQGPVVLRLPHMHGRHFGVTLIDTAGEPFGCLGVRGGHDVGVDTVLVGPHWTGELPRGLRARRSPSLGCWAVSRIHAYSSVDKAATAEIANRQSLTELHSPILRHGKQMPVLEPPTISCLRQAIEIAPALFFHRLHATFERAPAVFQKAHRAELQALQRQLGVPTENIDSGSEVAPFLAAGFADAVAAIRGAALTATTPQGPGWHAITQHHTPVPPTYVAGHVYAELGAPMREEVLTLACHVDESGQALSGSKSYRVHFPRDGMPPTKDFWRLHVRPAALEDQSHGIGDRNNLILGADGSLDIVAQHTPPRLAHIENWLATPEGQISLIMRLYSPRASALTGLWRMPAVRVVERDFGPPRRARQPRVRAAGTTGPDGLSPLQPPSRKLP